MFEVIKADLWIMWLEVSIFFASLLLVQILSLLLLPKALTGSEAAWGVGLYVGLKLQSTTGWKKKNQTCRKFISMLENI